MNNDRELLELAARAIGITLSYTLDTDKPYYMDGIRHYWNPLMEGNDAFILLSEHEFTVTSLPVSIGISQFNVGEYLVWQPKTVNNNLDLCRAITRAAAEIGKAL